MKTALTALAASFVWGTAFAFQRMAAGHIGAITFNFYRSVLAALSLGVLLFVSNRRKKPEERKKSDPKKIAIGGTVCGVLVIAASIVQHPFTVGIEKTVRWYLDHQDWGEEVYPARAALQRGVPA